nr:probable UDP-arabinose 4-epimerase 2 [Tanacetum cinerariifolium]
KIFSENAFDAVMHFVVVAYVGENFLILNVTSLKEEAVVMKKYGASNPVSFAGPIESDTYRASLDGTRLFDFLILNVTSLKEEAVVMKKYGASNPVSFAGPIESDTYRNTLIEHLLMELGC